MEHKSKKKRKKKANYALFLWNGNFLGRICICMYKM